MIRRLILFLVLGGLLIGCASAGYATYSGGYNSIGVYAQQDADLAWVVEKINNESIIRFDGDTCYLNASIYLYSGSADFHINDTVCKKLIMPKTVKLPYGHDFNINNIEIVGGSEIGTIGELHDVYLHDGGRFRLDKISTDVYNITTENTTSGGLYFYNSTWINVYNISVTNSTGQGVIFTKCNNTEVYDIRVEKIGDYTKGFHLTPTSEKFGFIMSSCNDCIAHDVYANDTAWSTIEITAEPGIPTSNVTFQNMTASYSGHNGFDFHSGGNAYIYNITSHDNPHSDGNNIFLSGVNNYTMKNLTSYNSGTSKGLQVARFVRDIYIENYTSDNDGCAFGSFDAVNITLIGGNINGSKDFAIKPSNAVVAGVTVPGVTDLKVFDTVISNGSTADIWTQNTTNTHFLNIKYNGLYYQNTIYDYDSNFYYYLDLVAKNADGSPVTGTATVSNGAFPSRDGNGNLRSVFDITSGRTATPAFARSEVAAIQEKHRSQTAGVVTDVKNIASIISVSNGTDILTLDKIIPSAEWYRPYTSLSEYTLTALFNDSENTHITGYAPSTDYNTFESGDPVTYKVWVSEPVDSVSWKKNGVEVATSGLTYTDTYTGDPLTVSFSATDANGDVSYTWDYNPEALPVAEFSADVTSGTAPLTVQFTDLSENALSWYWDFDNDGTVDNSTQNPEYTYSTAGTYTVNLTVVNGENTDSEVKELYISVESPSIITSYWNSFWAWWGMRWQITYWLEEAV